MTDSHLQELKLAWEACQSVEGEAAHLRERVRVGDLSQERLELAAYRGYEAALFALNQTSTVLRPGPTGLLEASFTVGYQAWQNDLQSFLRGLAPWSTRTVLGAGQEQQIAMSHYVDEVGVGLGTGGDNRLTIPGRVHSDPRVEEILETILRAAPKFQTLLKSGSRRGIHP